MADVTQDQITEALATVNDPEIKRPITELGMVDGVTIDGTEIVVRLLLTVSGCPLKDTLNVAFRRIVQPLKRWLRLTSTRSS